MKNVLVSILILSCWLVPTNFAFAADATSTAKMPGPWTQVSGKARDIGVDAQGVPWIISYDVKTAGGYAIFRRNGATWSRVKGGAVKIAVAPNGDVWTVDDAGNVRFRKFQDTSWRDIAGKAREITIAPDGVAWKIGTDADGADYSLYQYNGVGWDKVGGVASHFAVGSAGDVFKNQGTVISNNQPYTAANPWIIKSSGDIYWFHNNQWVLQEGLKASDIAVDRKGPAWLLGATAESDGNFDIYQDDGYHGSRTEPGVQEALQPYGYIHGFHWHAIRGSATRIVVQPNGTPWVLRQDGSIYVSSLKPPSGNLIITGLSAGLVVIRPDGTITKIDSNGTAQSAFDTAGNLYVAGFTKITKYLPDLTHPTIYYDGTKDGVDNIMSLAVDSKNDVFFSDWHDLTMDKKEGCIYMLTPDKVLRKIDNAPRVYGLACDAKGILYNSGFSHGGTFYKYTITDTTVTPSVYGQDQIRWNRTVAFDAAGNMYADGNRLIDPKKPDVEKGADGQWHAIKSNLQSGIFEIPVGGASAKFLVSSADRAESHPVGVICDPDGDIYNVDYYISRANPGVIYRNLPDGTYTLFASGFIQPMWVVEQPAAVKNSGTAVKP